MKTPLEIRHRFDFTSNLKEVVMINGDNLENCEDEDERQELLGNFNYLLNIRHFINHVGIDSVYNENALYIDYIMKGTPEENENGYFYEEYFEDSFGNKGNYYSCHNCPWSNEGLYQMEGIDLPCHTRTLANGEVIYDWRSPDDYIPAHWEGDIFVGARHKNDAARTDSYAQELINEVLEEIDDGDYEECQ